MITAANNIWNRFFGGHLDFRVWQFNVLSLASMLACLITLCVVPFADGFCRCFFHTAAVIVFQTGIWLYSVVRGNYTFCYMATCVGTFCVGLSYMFLVSGGYHGYTPPIFVLAAVMTAFILDGKKRIVMIAVELAVFTSLCVYAYIYPSNIIHCGLERHAFLSVMTITLNVAVALAITMTLQINLYNRRMRELDAARRQTEDYAKLNTELFARMSHEMRTPLTVMSVYAQHAVKQIRKNGANEQTLAGLATISGEAKRLAEMANGALRVMTASGGADEGDVAGAVTTDNTRNIDNALADIGDISVRLASMFTPIAEQKERTLTANIQSNIPPVRGDAAALTQLLWNILQNAVTFADKRLELTVEPHGAGVKITVVNDGDGIDQDILPRVFERGVSGKGGGSGMGLAICRDIARRHGGDISVESVASEVGAGGTRATVTLRGFGGTNV